jgi:hypothetical protein
MFFLDLVMAVALFVCQLPTTDPGDAKVDLGNMVNESTESTMNGLKSLQQILAALLQLR